MPQEPPVVPLLNTLYRCILRREEDKVICHLGPPTQKSFDAVCPCIKWFLSWVVLFWIPPHPTPKKSLLFLSLHGCSQVTLCSKVLLLLNLPALPTLKMQEFFQRKGILIFFPGPLEFLFFVFVWPLVSCVSFSAISYQIGELILELCSLVTEALWVLISSARRQLSLFVWFF